MDNIDENTFRRMISELQGLTGTMSRMSKSMDKSGNMYRDFQYEQAREAKQSREDRRSAKKAKQYDEDAFHNRLNRSAESVSGSLKLLKGGSEGVTSAFKDFSTKFLGGAIGGTLIGGLTGYISSLTTPFRELSEAGVGVTGGLIGMSKAAAEGGVTFEEYTRMMKRGSAVAAQLGGGSGSLAMLSKAVRKSTEDHGMFGYSIEQINDMTQDYVNTLGMSSSLARLDNDKARQSVTMLAKNTDDLAKTFGRNRAELDKQTRDLIQSTLFTTHLAEMDGKKRQGEIDKWTMALSGMSARLGPAGQILTKFVADSRSLDGNTHLAEGAMTFAKAGLPNIAGMVSKFNEQVASMDEANPEEIFKAQFDFTDKVMAEIKPQLNMLKYLANQGNAEAKAVVDMYNGHNKTLTKEAALAAFRKQKIDDDFSKKALAFTNKWNDLAGSIKAPLFEALGVGFERLSKALDSDIVKKAVSTIGSTLVSLSKTLSETFIRLFASDGTLESALAGLGKSVDGWLKWIESTLKNAGSLSAMVGTAVTAIMVGAVKGVGSAMIGALGNLTTPFKDMGATIAGVIAALVLFKTAMAVKGMWNTVTGKGSSANVANMNVTARVVNVYGGSGGAGLGGGDSPDKPNKPNNKRGRAGRAWDAAKGLGGKALRGAKGIPVLGSLLTGGLLMSDLGDIKDRKAKGEIDEKTAESETTKTWGKAAGAVAGTMLGGMIGSIIPGAGTIVGGALGSAVGGFVGDAVGGWLTDYFTKENKTDTNARVRPEQPKVSGTASDIADKMSRTAGQVSPIGAAYAASGIAAPVVTPREQRTQTMEEELKKKQAALEMQKTEENKEISLQLIREVQALKESVEKQTSMMTKQNAEQTEVLKESRNKLAGLDQSS